MLSLALILVGPSASQAQDAPGTISGSVYLDTNGTGTPTGQGVPNVQVTATAGSTSESRTTGPDGSFSFQLPPGRYSVTVHPPGDYRTTSEPQLSVVVNSRKTTGGVMFGLARKSNATPTPTPKPAEPTATPKPAQPSATPKPVESPAAQVQGERSAPAPLFAPPPLFATPSASPSPSADTGQRGPEAASGSRGSRPSGEDILAGRGVHWRLIDGQQALTVEAQSAAETTASRPVVTSLEALRRVSVSQLQSWADDSTLWLGVPFRTQLDGTEFSRVNCGPTSLAMVLAAFGLEVGPASIRDYVNYLTGHYDPEEGTSLDVLAGVAAQAGLTTFGLYGGGDYRTWTIEDIRQHVRAGHPIITLVKYRSLPGNGESLAEFDHYIVITGMAGEDLIYNDSAFSSDYGFNLLISPEDLELAWSYSSIPRHALAIGLGDSLRPLPNAPRVNAASLAMGPESRVEPPLAMIPGPAALWLREKMLAESGVSALGEPVSATQVVHQGSAEPLSLVRETAASEVAARPIEAEEVALLAEPPAADLAVLPPSALGEAGTAPPPTPDGPATALAIYAVVLLILAETLRRHRLVLAVAGAELGGRALARTTSISGYPAVRGTLFAVSRVVPAPRGFPVVGVANLPGVARPLVVVRRLGVILSAAKDLRARLSDWRDRRSFAALRMTPRAGSTIGVWMRRGVRAATFPFLPFRSALDRLWPTADSMAAMDEGVHGAAARFIAPIRLVLPRRRAVARSRRDRDRRPQAARGRPAGPAFW